MEYKVYPGVVLGRGVRIDPYCILGKPQRGKKPGDLDTVIGDNSVIRSCTAIYSGTKTGRGLQTGHGVLIREDNIIGDNASIGTNAVLEPGNRIGNNTRVHTGCFLENVRLGSNVVVGPNVVFTDDPHPPCPRYKECGRFVVVEDNAKIGANATILPGVRIGRNALIGAGSVVARDVRPGMVVMGSPAREVKGVSELKCFKGFFKRPYEWEG